MMNLRFAERGGYVYKYGVEMWCGGVGSPKDGTGETTVRSICAYDVAAMLPGDAQDHLGSEQMLCECEDAAKSRRGSKLHRGYNTFHKNYAMQGHDVTPSPNREKKKLQQRRLVRVQSNAFQFRHNLTKMITNPDTLETYLREIQPWRLGLLTTTG